MPRFAVPAADEFLWSDILFKPAVPAIGTQVASPNRCWRRLDSFRRRRGPRRSLANDGMFQSETSRARNDKESTMKARRRFCARLQAANWGLELLEDRTLLSAARWPASCPPTPKTITRKIRDSDPWLAISDPTAGNLGSTLGNLGLNDWQSCRSADGNVVATLAEAISTSLAITAWTSPSNRPPAGL